MQIPVSSVQDARYFAVDKSTASHLMSGRRAFLLQAGALMLCPGFSLARLTDETYPIFPVQYSDEEWKRRLGNARFRVMRQVVMETPLSSSLLRETRDGVYLCAGCQQALFSSRQKLHKVGAWPTFSAPIRNSAISLGPREDWTALLHRRIYCSRCGGYLGMVFNDGADGFRFAINGLSLQFLAAKESSNPNAAGLLR